MFLGGCGNLDHIGAANGRGADDGAASELYQPLPYRSPGQVCFVDMSGSTGATFPKHHRFGAGSESGSGWYAGVLTTLRGRSRVDIPLQFVYAT